MARVQLCTYRRNILFVIISISVNFFLFFFLFKIRTKTNEFQLPIYNSYFKSYTQEILSVQQSNNTILDKRYFYNSTCSFVADKRGPHQRVIAYSLYGNLSREDVFNKYVLPLKSTINLIPLIYPGWIVRIYHNLTIEDELKSFIKDHVDLCNATEIIQMRKLGDLFAMTWRWLPLLDGMVDVLMSRDCDTMIISREKEAVNEWLASNKSFHIMRDHPAHCIFGFIMGCCWGVKVSHDRSSIMLAAEKMFIANHFHTYDYDQILLDKLIWPVAEKNSIVHDSYCCEVFPNTQPFPKPRKDRNYVGSRSLGPKLIMEELSDLDECPRRCRPTNNEKSNFC